MKVVIITSLFKGARDSYIYLPASAAAAASRGWRRSERHQPNDMLFLSVAHYAAADQLDSSYSMLLLLTFFFIFLLLWSLLL